MCVCVCGGGGGNPRRAKLCLGEEGGGRGEGGANAPLYHLNEVLNVHNIIFIIVLSHSSYYVFTALI